MIIYDKAVWHIDGGEQALEVVSRFKDIFEFLRDKKMLSEEGLESLEYCMDDSISLNSTMVNDEGKAFLDAYYDSILNRNPKEIKQNLQEAYDTITSDRGLNIGEMEKEKNDERI